MYDMAADFSTSSMEASPFATLIMVLTTEGGIPVVAEIAKVRSVGRGLFTAAVRVALRPNEESMPARALPAWLMRELPELY
jgi:hypothetical protein